MKRGRDRATAVSRWEAGSFPTRSTAAPERIPVIGWPGARAAIDSPERSGGSPKLASRQHIVAGRPAPGCDAEVHGCAAIDSGSARPSPFGGSAPSRSGARKLAAFQQAAQCSSCVVTRSKAIAGSRAARSATAVRAGVPARARESPRPKRSGRGGHTIASIERRIDIRNGRERARLRLALTRD